MDHLLKINLIDRASIAVVSSLWNQYDIVSDINSFLLGTQNCKNWINIENTVISNLTELKLPDVLEQKLNNLVQPIGMQVFKWMSLTQSTFQAYPHLGIFHFTFNERGILDSSKTAEQIIQSSSDKTLCFCLACIFCIEESILKLWPDVKPYLTNKVRNNISSVESVAVIYWVYFLNSEIEELMTLTEYCGMKNAHEFGFLFLLELRCLPSLNYFLKYIQPERKQRLIFLALQNIFHTGRPRDGNIVVFLFRHLTEPDSNVIISENCYSVLASLLEWPSHEFFMQVLDSAWVLHSLSNLEYLNLLQDMVELVSRYHIGYIYKNLTIQFWRSTPPSFKEYVKNKCVSGTFLSRLFLYEHTNDIIQMIFNDFSQDEKQQVIFHFEGMNICDLLVKKERWDSLKLLVKNCIPNQSVLEEFIEEYENYKPYYFNEEMKDRTKILVSKIKEWY